MCHDIRHDEYVTQCSTAAARWSGSWIAADKGLERRKDMTNRTRRRIGTLVLAPAAALAAWACLRLAGLDFDVKTGDGAVGPVDVVTAAFVGSLAGWFVVRLVERHSRSPRLWWARIGSTALAISTIGPAYLSDGISALALTALHFVTAIVVITGFATTLPTRCCESAASSTTDRHMADTVGL
jgi:FtsH-binding integral membrane protein